MKAKKGLFLGLGALMFIGLAGILLWAKGPYTALIKVQNKEVKGAVSSDNSTELVEYDQLTLQVPRRFVAKNKTTGEGKPLYVQQLFTVPVKSVQSIFGDQLALTIGNVGQDGLVYVSDVQIRKRDSTYTFLQESDDILVYEKESTTYETGVFVQKNDLYVSLVFSGPSINKNQLKQELSSLLASVQWR